MASMIQPLLRNEFDKALRRKLPYLGLAGCLAATGLLFWVAGEARREVQFSGWSFLQYAMQFTMQNVGLMFVAIFSAGLVAEERSGPIRTVLAAPVSRIEFFFAKLLAGLGYMVVLTLVTLAVAAAMASLRYSFGPVLEGEDIIYPRREVMLNFLAAFLLDWLPLTAVVLFGLLVSLLSRNAGQAIGATIGLLVVLETVKSALKVKDYVFTTHIGGAWYVFQQVAQGLDYLWREELPGMVLVPLAYSLVFLVAGLWIVHRRDWNG